MIPLRDQEFLRQRFKTELTNRLRIDFFTQKPSSIFIPGRQACVYCKEIEILLEEIAAFNDRIALTMHEYDAVRTLAANLGVDKAPAIVIRGHANRPLRFFGLPSGTEFLGFIDTLLDAARGSVDLKPETTRQLRKLRTDVRLQVLVTTSCPYCPSVVRTATKLGLQSSRIKVDVVELAEFPAVVQRYAVRAVPTTVIGEKLMITGSVEEPALVECLFQVAEGKPLSAQPRVGAATALAPVQSQTQSRPASSSSRLILPR